MLLATQSDVLFKRVGYKKGIEIIKSAGFDAIDFSSFTAEFYEGDVIKKAKEIREYADLVGITFNQAHSPFPTSFFEEDKNSDVFEKTVKAIEVASILGVKNIIVHPKQHLKYIENDNPAILKNMNVDFYRSLIPYCKKFNVTVCLENMYQMYKENDIWRVTPSTCSSPQEFKEYLDLIDSPYICACLDIGHANMLEHNIPEFIKTLGEKLVALHVHEAQGNWDFHRAPYIIGNTKWAEVLKALKDINYTGDLTFEADNTLLRMPNDLLEPTAVFMAKIGRSMINQYNNL